MADPVFHGICANCIHARTCRYSLNAARPVHFCDHYEVNGQAPGDDSSNTEQPGPGPRQDSGKATGDPPPAATRKRADAAARRREGSGAGAGRQFRGLCVDCVKRFDCEMAGTESGVWHCREYQGPADDDE